MRNSNISRDLSGLRGGRRVLPLLLAGLVATVASPVFAIDPNRAMSQYIHDRWGPEQGFPRGPVYAITQSADGYLWIGTEAGLVRFDGSNFQLVAASSPALPVAGVLGLVPDNEGNLWVRLQGPRMIRYRDGAFEDPMAGLPYTNITAMSRTKDGALVASATEQGTITYREGKFALVAEAAVLPRSPVISIAQTSDGAVWMGTRGAGLFRMAGGKASLIAGGLPDPKVNCLLAGSNGDLWVGTDMGVVRWTGARFAAVDMGGTGRRLQALAMVRDRDLNLWVGTNSRGLLRLNDRGVASLPTVHSGSTEAVTAVFEDREGAVWFGSASGIERLRDSPFVTYSSSEGLATDGSHPVFVDSEKRMWFAPVSGGLWWLKDGLSGHVAESGLDRDVVYSIAGSRSKGELWLGRQRGGLTRLRMSDGSFQATSFQQSEGLAQNSVYSVHTARDGTVWAGTLSGGVSRLRDGRFTTYTIENGLASNTVASIEEGADGTIWFATPTGLSALGHGRWQSFRAANGLPSENVNCLLADSGGVLWVGTAAGLAFRSDSGFRVPDGLPGTLREQILGMAEDRLGSLWIATSNHVIRVKRDKLIQGSLADGDVREYGNSDGLRGLEGVKRHRSVVADPDGRIWFSMNRGVSVVDPGRLSSSSAPSIAHVQGVSADGVAVGLRGPVRVPAGSRRIAFAFAGLSLSFPERVRFRYRLDGFDQKWSEPVAAREAIYTNLGPRTYRFRVIASNPDGAWTSAESALEFDLVPLFWQTWWFRLCVLAAIALAVAAVYRMRLHDLTKQLNVRFEERLAERTRIAQELHDTLLQGFLSASMQLHVAADRLPADSPAKPSVGRVLQLMGQVIEEGRNAVRGLRSTEYDSRDLAQAFLRIREELAIGEAVEFRVIVEGRPLLLHPIIRDEVYRIGREALVNAFRHSRAAKIEIELEYAARQFRFLVRDNGCGIEPSVIQSGREGHWGLLGMRERAERIGAQLHVWSSGTAGTEVELSVPRHIAYQAQASNRARGWLSRLFPRSDSAEPTRGKNGGSE